MTKFLNLILGMLFMGDKLVGFADAFGCLFALLGGFWYSYELQTLNEKNKAAAK